MLEELLHLTPPRDIASELGGHPVEGAREPTDLVPAGVVDAAAEFTPADGRRRVGHPTETPDDGPGDDRGNDRDQRHGGEEGDR